MFKKLISVLVVSCFMISIMNLPAYSAISELEQIGNIQIQEEYTGDYVSVNAVNQTDSKAKPKAAAKTSKPKATKVSAAVKKTANKAVNAVNKLLKKKGISKTAKTWLKKAKTLINSIKNGTKSNKDKQSLLNKALKAIKAVTKAKGSDLSLAQQSYSSKSVFSTLKKVLKNNIIYKIYAKYTTKGVNVIKTFAKKVGLKVKTVYNAFVKMGVTKTQMKKVGSVLLNLMKKGEKFVNCAANSVSKFLNISKNLAAVYNLAADISIDATRFINSNKKGFSGTYSDAQLKTLQKNGYKNASRVSCSLSDFMSGLKVGERAILHLDSFNTKGKKVGGHAIIIIREKNGYAVSNNLINGGKKITFNATEFKKLINGKKATGKTASGKKITTPIYYNTTSGKHSYKAIINGEMTVITNSKDIINKQVVNNYNTNISITYQPSADAKSSPKAVKTKKTVSLTSKIIKKYTKAGLTTLKAFANKLGLKLKTVYNQFVKYGVTKTQMKKVASGLLKIIKRGANFTAICSTLAVSKYLGISKAFTAVQQIAAEISLNFFNPNSTKYYMSTTWTAQAKVLSKNGVKNSEEYYVKLADLLNLKKGSKMLVNADCYNTKGQPDGCHAITITREKNGKYGVYDVLVNGGNKVIYTKAQIKRLLAGKSAKGKTTSGKTITKTKYLATAYGYLSYKFTTKNGNGSILIIGDSSKVLTPKEKSLYNKSISLVNKLLKKKGLSKSAKTWLTKAKKLIINTLNSNKSYRKKEDLLDNAYSLLKQISSKSVSTISLVIGSTSIFSSLKSLLKNTLTYKIYGKYGENGAKVISAIAKKYNLNQNTIYNTFVNNKVTKGQMDFLWDSILNSLKDEDPFIWRYAYSSVNGAMSSIEKLVKPSSASPKAPAAPKAVKKTSLTNKIIKKYTKKGLTALKALANKFGFSLKTVYRQFVRYGVTKKDIKKVAPTIIKLVQRGVSLTCCASLATAKYLGISNNFSALQNLAAYVSKSPKDFVRLNKNERVIVGYPYESEVLQKNGKKVGYYSVSLKDFMNNLKAGQKALFYVPCLNRNGSIVDGHALTVVKEKNGKYGVYDTLSNGGNKVIYSKDQFKKFIKGKSAIGKTTSGRTITKPVYYNSTSGVIKYKFINNGKLGITTDSKSIRKVVIKKSYEYKLAKNIVSKINKLSKEKGISSLAKKWLKEAKSAVSKFIYGPKNLSDKRLILKDAINTINSVTKAKASILSLVKATAKTRGKYTSVNIFSSLKSVLKNNLTYKVYTKYGEQGIKALNYLPKKYNLSNATIYKMYEKYGEPGMTVISVISKKYNLNPVTVYNQFVNNKVTKQQIYLYGLDYDVQEDDFFDWKYDNVNLDNAIEAIKKLIYNANNSNGNIESQINFRYGEEGVNLINEISKRYNLDKATVYNKFVKNDVTKNQLKTVNLTDDLKNGYDIFNFGWGPDNYNLGKALDEIRQLIDNKTVSTNTLSTAKPQAVPSAPKAVKSASLTSKIIKKYTKKGLTALKALANKFGLKLKTVYNQFVKYGVTKKQMKKVASGLLKMIRRGADFCVCSTTAVSKYLGISKHFTAVQQIAAEISLNYFNPKNKNHYIATTHSAQVKVLSKNGVKNVEGYSVKLSDLLSMKKGHKIYVSTDCYNRGGQKIDAHAITITREKNGKYGVYDILVNGGNKVIYTKAQIKRLLSGKSAKGKTSSGRTITKPKYLNSADGYISYKFINYGGISIIGNSTKIVGQYTKDSYKKNISIINKLLKKKNLNSVVRTWLKKAKILVNKIYKSNKKDSIKDNLLNGGKYWLANIKAGGATILSIAETSKNWSGMAPIFSSLKSVLKNNITYKIFDKYGKQGVTLIRNLSKKFNISQTSIYNQLVKGGVDQYFLYGVSADKFESINAFYSSLGINVSQNNNTVNNQKEESNVDKNSIDYKINAKYGQKGLSLINEFSTKFNLSKDTVYNIFMNNGVTEDDTDFYARFISEDLKKDNFFNIRYGSDNINKAIASMKELINNKEQTNKLSAALPESSLAQNIVSTSQKVTTSTKSISLTDKIVSTYGESGNDLIKAISNKYNLSQSTVYNKFLENKVTKDQMDIVSDILIDDLNNERNIFRRNWGSAYSSVGKTLLAIKELIGDVGIALAA